MTISWRCACRMIPTNRFFATSVRSAARAKVGCRWRLKRSWRKPGSSPGLLANVKVRPVAVLADCRFILCGIPSRAIWLMPVWPQNCAKKLTGHLDDKSHGIYTHHEFATIRAALEKLGRLPKPEAPR